MAKRKKLDWEAIKKEWDLSQVSIREIARQHGCTEKAIRDKSKKECWCTRDLAGRVNKKIQDKLVRTELRKKIRNDNIADKDLIEHAADRGVAVIQSHRSDITRLRNLEAGLIKELSGTPTKLYMTQYQGKIIEKEIGLTVHERAQAANNLANVQHKRIQLERQAFNLKNDDDTGDTKVSETVVILPAKDKI